MVSWVMGDAGCVGVLVVELLWNEGSGRCGVLYGKKGGGWGCVEGRASRLALELEYLCSIIGVTSNSLPHSLFVLCIYTERAQSLLLDTSQPVRQ